MVSVGPPGIDINLVDVPVGLLPVHVAYVPNAPMSNSLGLKYEAGGGGGAGTTSFGEGGPAKDTTACEAMVATAKANSPFIIVAVWLLGVWFGSLVFGVLSTTGTKFLI